MRHAREVLRLVLAAVHDEHFMPMPEQLRENRTPDKASPAEEHHSHAGLRAKSV